MILIIIGRAVQFLLLFATLKISTTLLAPAEMAKVYLFAAIFSFFALLFINPVGMFINRRLHAWNNAGRVQDYLKYYWSYVLVSCLVALLLLELLIQAELIELHTETRWISVIIVGTLLFTTVNQSVIPWLNLLGYRNWFVGFSLGTAAASLIAATLLVELISQRAEYWQSGLLIGQLLLACLGWRVFYSRLNARTQTSQPTILHVNTLLKFAWPVALSVGLGWFQSQSYRFMMEPGLGLHALGLFAAGYGISAGIISAFEQVFTAYLQPIFYKNISNDNVHQQSGAWREYAGAMFPSLILVSFAIYATAPELTRIMLGPDYWSASQFIVWGVIAELARVGSGIYGMVAHARMKTWLLLVPGLAGACLSVALIWWLMPMYGSNGVGVALTISASAAFILTYAFTRNEFAANLPHGKLIKSMLMGSALLLLAEILREAMQASLLASAVLLSATGSAFMFFQFILLRPLWQGNKT